MKIYTYMHVIDLPTHAASFLVEYGVSAAVGMSPCRIRLCRHFDVLSDPLNKIFYTRIPSWPDTVSSQLSQSVKGQFNHMGD